MNRIKSLLRYLLTIAYIGLFVFSTMFMLIDIIFNQHSGIMVTLMKCSCYSVLFSWVVFFIIDIVYEKNN